MSSLTLRLRESAPRRIDLNGLVPSSVLPLDNAQIGNLPLAASGKTAPLRDWFDICDGHRNHLTLAGDLQHCDRIAGGMRGGKLIVDSDVGDHLADSMVDGQLIIRGSAGRYAGGGLRGGSVEIHGDVGDYAAAAQAHVPRGMSGGRLVIGGNGGKWLGQRMRRGTVLVRGSVDQGCGSRLIAGTIVVAGQLQPPFAYGMARGTILLLDPVHGLPDEIAAGFTPPERCELSFLPILLSDLAGQLDQWKLVPARKSSWARCVGDRGVGGLGEIIFCLANRDAPAGSVPHA